MTATRTTSKYVAVLAVSVLALTGCGRATSDGGDSGTSETSTGSVTLGLLAPLTGPSAADGQLMEQGAQLAVDELNEKGGVAGREVQLRAVDVKDQSSDAVSSAVSSLIADDEVVAVLTGYASTTNFEIDLLAEAEMPYLLSGNSTQTADIITKDPDKYPGIWSVSPSYDGYNTDLPMRLKAFDADGTFPLRNRKAYVISSDNPYSNGIAEGLTANLKSDGWEVTGDTVPFGEVGDWTTQISKIRKLDPSLIINLDYQTSNAAKFLTQFRQNPTDSLVFSQYAPSVPEFIELAGENADGVLYNLPIAPLAKQPRTQEITRKFEEAYDADPGIYGIALYEQVMLWAKAAEAVGDPTKRAEVGVALGETEEETSLGRIVFDPETHLAKVGDEFLPMTSYQIQDGKRVTISPPAYADGAFQAPPWIG